jgi:hypothetical protein
MTDETKVPSQLAVRSVARMKQLPAWKNLSWFTREVLMLKLTTTDGDLIKAIAIQQPRASDADNRELARAILSDPNVAGIEFHLGTMAEEIERENAAKEQAS